MTIRAGERKEKMIRALTRFGLGILLFLSIQSTTWAQGDDFGLPPTADNAQPAQGFQVQPGVNPGPVTPPPAQDLQLARPATPRERTVVEVEYVKEEFAGWQAASPLADGVRVSNNLRSNWVMADPNGRVDGRVYVVGSASLDNFNIYLLQSGRLISTTNVQRDGTFAFTNITAGAYSLVGLGDNGFFTFGFNAIGFRETNEIPKTLQVTAFQNKTTINLDWIRYFAPQVKFRVFGQYSKQEGSDDPASLYGFEGVQAFPPSANPATSILNHQVKLTEDGKVRGRIHQFNSLHGRPVDLRETKVMLLQEDEVVGSTTTDLFGVFEFENVTPGEYAVVAAGEDGLGCIGVQVVGVEGGAGHMIDFTLSSAESVGWLNQNAIEIAYNRVIMRPQPKDPNENTPGEFFGMNGQCGFGNFGMQGRSRRGFFSKVTSGVNRFFDIMFYPEEYQRYGAGNQGTGYGNYPGGRLRLRLSGLGLRLLR